MTLPTGIALVHTGEVVSRMTTSYPVMSGSGFAAQSSEVRLVPGNPAGGAVWISTFFGVAGLVASAHSAAAFTAATRAV